MAGRRAQGGGRESDGPLPTAGPGFTQCHRGREAKEWKILRLPFLLPPDAALGNAGAVAETWAAADPGWGPHPGRAALLSALPGGRGRPRASESGAVHALFSRFGFYLFPLKKNQTEITPTHCDGEFQTWAKKEKKTIM